MLECSTGNAGIACAFVAAVKGYRCTIVMPEGMSDERKKIMRAYGADLVFTPGGESDVDLSLQRLDEIRAARSRRLLGAGAVRQRRQRRGPLPHDRARDLGADAAASIGAFVASQGSGGHARPASAATCASATARVRLYARRARGVRAAGAARVGTARHRGHRRRLHPRQPRRLAALRRHHHDHRREPDDGAAACCRGRHLLRHLDRLQRGRRAEAGARAIPSCRRS